MGKRAQKQKKLVHPPFNIKIIKNSESIKKQDDHANVKQKVVIDADQ